MLPRLRASLDELVAKHARFEAGTRALSEAQLRFRPAVGAWSIAEVAQHLLQVEREVVKAAAKPGVERSGRKRNAAEWIGFLMFRAIVRLNVRIKVPRRVAGRVTPASDPDMDTLWAEWSEVRARLESYLESLRPVDLRLMAFKHPIMGPTSVKGVLQFFHQHFDHHMRQVARIRRSPDFPRA